MDFFLFVSELIVYMTTGVEYKINTSVLALNMATYPRNFQALPFNYFLTFFFFFGHCLVMENLRNYKVLIPWLD